MKKSIIALLLALLLLVSFTTAFAQPEYLYTLDEFKTGLDEMVMALKGVPVTYSEPLTDQDGRVYVETSCTELQPIRIYLADDGIHCAGFSVSITVSIYDSTAAYNESNKLGYTTSCLVFVSRYIELGFDKEKTYEEYQSLSQGIFELMQFSESDLSGILVAPLVREKTVANHTGRMIISLDMSSETLSYTFEYLP